MNRQIWKIQMTQAQFHIRREQREGENRKDIETLLMNCFRLEQRLKSRLKEHDPDATVKLDGSGQDEAFSIECDLNPQELIEEIRVSIIVYSLSDRASRITTQ